MFINKSLVILAAALSFGLASPVFAQTSSGDTGAGNGMSKGAGNGMSKSDTDSGPGATKGTPATEKSGGNMRPGKSANPSGSPKNNDMSK